MNDSQHLWISRIPLLCEKNELETALGKYGCIGIPRYLRNDQSFCAIAEFKDARLALHAKCSIVALNGSRLKMEYCNAAGEPGILGLRNFRPQEPFSSVSSKEPRGLKISCIPYQRLSKEQVRRGLESEFRRFGRILSVTMVTDASAVITFRRAEESHRALQSTRNGEKVLFSTRVMVELHPGFDKENDRSLAKEPNGTAPSHERSGLDKETPSHTCPTRTLYVGGLTASGASGPVTQEQLNIAFKKFGEILSVEMKPDMDAACIQFLEMRGTFRAMTAHTRDPLKLGGRPLRLAYTPSPPSSCLWLADVPSGLVELGDRGLLECFSRIVPVKDVVLINRPDPAQRAGASRNTQPPAPQPARHFAAFVRLDSECAATKMLLHLRTHGPPRRNGHQSQKMSLFPVDFASARQICLVESLQSTSASKRQVDEVQRRAGGATPLEAVMLRNGTGHSASEDSRWEAAAKCPLPAHPIIKTAPRPLLSTNGTVGEEGSRSRHPSASSQASRKCVTEEDVIGTVSDASSSSLSSTSVSSAGASSVSTMSPAHAHSLMRPQAQSPLCSSSPLKHFLLNGGSKRPSPGSKSLSQSASLLQSTVKRLKSDLDSAKPLSTTPAAPHPHLQQQVQSKLLSRLEPVPAKYESMYDKIKRRTHKESRSDALEPPRQPKKEQRRRRHHHQQQPQQRKQKRQKDEVIRKSLHSHGGKIKQQNSLFLAAAAAVPRSKSDHRRAVPPSQPLHHHNNSHHHHHGHHLPTATVPAHAQKSKNRSRRKRSASSSALSCDSLSSGSSASSVSVRALMPKPRDHHHHHNRRRHHRRHHKSHKSKRSRHPHSSADEEEEDEEADRSSCSAGHRLSLGHFRSFPDDDDDEEEEEEEERRRRRNAEEEEQVKEDHARREHELGKDTTNLDTLNDSYDEEFDRYSVSTPSTEPMESIRKSRGTLSDLDTSSEGAHPHLDNEWQTSEDEGSVGNERLLAKHSSISSAAEEPSERVHAHEEEEEEEGDEEDDMGEEPMRSMLGVSLPYSASTTHFSSSGGASQLLRSPETPTNTSANTSFLGGTPKLTISSDSLRSPLSSPLLPSVPAPQQPVTAAPPPPPPPAPPAPTLPPPVQPIAPPAAPVVSNLPPGVHAVAPVMHTPPVPAPPAPVPPQAAQPAPALPTPVPLVKEESTKASPRPAVITPKVTVTPPTSVSTGRAGASSHRRGESSDSFGDVHTYVRGVIERVRAESVVEETSKRSGSGSAPSAGTPSRRASSSSAATTAMESVPSAPVSKPHDPNDPYEPNFDAESPPPPPPSTTAASTIPTSSSSLPSSSAAAGATAVSLSISTNAAISTAAMGQASSGVSVISPATVSPSVAEAVAVAPGPTPSCSDNLDAVIKDVVAGNFDMHGYLEHWRTHPPSALTPSPPQPPVVDVPRPLLSHAAAAAAATGATTVKAPEAAFSAKPQLQLQSPLVTVASSTSTPPINFFNSLLSALSNLPGTTKVVTTDPTQQRATTISATTITLPVANLHAAMLQATNSQQQQQQQHQAQPPPLKPPQQPINGLVSTAAPVLMGNTNVMNASSMPRTTAAPVEKNVIAFLNNLSQTVNCQQPQTPGNAAAQLIHMPTGFNPVNQAAQQQQQKVLLNPLASAATPNMMNAQALLRNLHQQQQQQQQQQHMKGSQFPPNPSKSPQPINTQQLLDRLREAHTSPSLGNAAEMDLLNSLIQQLTQQRKANGTASCNGPTRSAVSPTVSPGLACRPPSASSAVSPPMLSGLLAKCASPIAQKLPDSTTQPVAQQPQKKAAPQQQQVQQQQQQQQAEFPLVWQGSLSLKNTEARVKLHYVKGNMRLLESCMSLLAVGGGGTPQQALITSGGPLRIVQRMRLEPSQLEGVSRKMAQEGASCACIAFAAGQTQAEFLQQTCVLKESFISYMQEKMAAGIINVCHPEDQQGLYVVHIFPPCEFSRTQLRGAASELYCDRLQKEPHLLVVITTV